MNESSGNLNYVAPVFRVSDLARSLAYYCAQLGFGVEFNYEGFYASVCRDGAHIHLQCGASAPRDQAAFEEKELLDACIVVQNAKALAGAFKAAGAAFTVLLRQMPYGSEFYIRDPDGYILGFVQPAAD